MSMTKEQFRNAWYGYGHSAYTIDWMIEIFSDAIYNGFLHPDYTIHTIDEFEEIIKGVIDSEGFWAAYFMIRDSKYFYKDYPFFIYDTGITENKLISYDYYHNSIEYWLSGMEDPTWTDEIINGIWKYLKVFNKVKEAEKELAGYGEYRSVCGIKGD